MEFYYGGPSSNAWNDATSFENHLSSMEKSFQTKRYFLPTIISGLFILSLIAIVAL